ncbi:MAG TPA: AAA family ATPase [Candidatus Saccharimonadales bacterium]|nr:AAA family ATPase [Candidatus Saccharimonadales bacterium]
MDHGIDLKSVRARKARLASKLGKSGLILLAGFAGVLSIGAPLIFIDHNHKAAYLLLALADISLMLAVWAKRDLYDSPPVKNEGLQGRLSGEVLSRLDPSKTVNASVLWQALQNHWQSMFFTNRFLIPPDAVGQFMDLDKVDLGIVLAKSQELADGNGLDLIEPGQIVAALLITSPGINALLEKYELSTKDIESGAKWLGRIIKVINAKKSRFNGVGRDWTQGFTPLLSQFGHNISLAVEKNGSFFESLVSSNGVIAIKNILLQEPASIALVGDPGVGKTSHMYGLAQALLDQKDKRLSDYKIISLDSSILISNATRRGDIEHIVVSLLRESVNAGHIVLFFDDAQLFFKNAAGSIDITQILLPVIQSRAVRLVFAMTGSDFQSLKASHANFSSLLTPVMLTEPNESKVIEVLEDTAINFEYQRKLGITYEALREAYRLSGRYEQESAYPGKAIKMLQQALQYPDHGLIVASSVQKVIEQTKGVKVGAAAPTEANELLNLEAKIHDRMINQKRAVEVVSGALRRNRAGVSNPNRPIGSFLFLGPTGVGKTELAKAISAIYFKSESGMIRIDMSEYQQAEDVKRLLGDGREEASSLILSVRQRPFSVVLLDEIEKAHPNVLNLLLQLLDEGKLTDSNGRAVSFKDCIIIATSNAGAQKIREKVGQGQNLETFEASFIDELISDNLFRPELLNRFDEVVLFRPLNESELAEIVKLMMNEVNVTLSNKNISVELTDRAINKIVSAGYDARLGARPMRRVLQKAVEDVVANKILKGEIKSGDHVTMDEADLSL